MGADRPHLSGEQDRSGSPSSGEPKSGAEESRPAGSANGGETGTPSPASEFDSGTVRYSPSSAGEAQPSRERSKGLRLDAPSPPAQGSSGAAPEASAPPGRESPGSSGSASAGSSPEPAPRPASSGPASEDETFLPTREVQDSAAEFASTEAEREDLIGSLRDRYRLTRVLGKGGFGVVYLAHDRVLDQDVAIKVLKLGVANDTYRKRFIFEARTAARLRHSAIVNVFDIRQTESGLQLVMEYYAGGTVDEMIRRETKIEPKTALKMIRQMTEGLAYAHKKGIIHRDIKPGNMFLATDGTVKLGDFGICARYETHDHTMTGEVMGTPIYMAPEQHRDSKDVDPRSDIYALGMTLFHMVTGKPPRVVNLDLVPDQLRTIVAKTTAYDRRDRPASAQQLIAMIDKALREWDSSAAGIGPKESTLGSAPGPDSIGLSEEEPAEAEGLTGQETMTAYHGPGSPGSHSAVASAGVGAGATSGYGEAGTAGGGGASSVGVDAAGSEAGAESCGTAARKNSTFLLVAMGLLAVIATSGAVFLLLPDEAIGPSEEAGDAVVADLTQTAEGDATADAVGEASAPDGADEVAAGGPEEVAPDEPVADAPPPGPDEPDAVAGTTESETAAGDPEPERMVASAPPNPLLAAPRREEFERSDESRPTIEEYMAEGGRRDALDAAEGVFQSLDAWIVQAELPTGAMLLDAAQLKLRRAAENYPDDAFFPYLRGRLYEATGDESRARAQYARVRELDADFLADPVREVEKRLALTGYEPKNEALAKLLATPPADEFSGSS